MGDSKPPYLPHHLITEILSWLPPETLVRFTTVCKLWSSIIVNPKFIQLHRSHFCNSHPNAITDRIVNLAVIPGPSTPTLKLRVFPDSNPRNFPYSYELIANNREGCGWYISGICNGLFCCTAFHGGSSHLVFLCNPCIRRTIPIPWFKFYIAGFHYGVGFDAVKNDYKVVRISGHPPYSREKIAVFSLNSNVWKRLDAEVSIPYQYCFMSFDRSIFLNGFIHWVILPTVKNLYNGILCFDVHNEVFGTMQMPSMLSTKYIRSKTIDLSMMKGLLSITVAEFWSTNSRKFYEVWTMNEYGIAESWTKLFRVQLPRGVYFHGGLTFSGKIMLGKYSRDGNLVRVGEGEDELPQHLSWSLYDPETLERSYLSRTMQIKNYSLFAIEASLELLDYGAGILDKYRPILL